jgi:hypothetical protein
LISNFIYQIKEQKMIRKLILGVLFVGLMGLLIFGAVNRTIAKSGSPLVIGLNRDTQIEQSMANEEVAINEGYGRVGSGQGRASQAETNWEGDSDGQDHGSANNNSQMNGNQSVQGRGGQGRNSGNNNANPTVPSEVVSFEGWVESVTNEALVVTTQDGSSVVIEGRAWRFAQEIGYTLQVNKQVRITGFNEDGEFKAATLTRMDSGEAVQLRESNGRPNWAGGGRGANKNNT